MGYVGRSKFDLEYFVLFRTSHDFKHTWP